MIRPVLVLALAAGSLGLSACDAKTLTAALDTASDTPLGYPYEFIKATQASW